MLFSTTTAPTRKMKEWLAQHPNAISTITPTSASWLNQVEIWFGILGRKTLSGASLRRAQKHVSAAIRHFVNRLNETASASLFGASGKEYQRRQLRNTIANLCN